MKSRTFFSAIALIAGLVLFVGIAVFGGLTSQDPRTLMTAGGQPVPTAAQFVPRQAPIMISLLARPDRLWNLRQLQTSPGKRFQAQEEWQSLKATLTDWLGWDYDADVRPWLDQEITVAVTAADIDHESSNGQQAGYLVVLSCRDGQKAREAIHLLWQQRAISGQNLVFETVSGIPLIYDRNPTGSAVASSSETPEQSPSKFRSLASAVISDRYVLIANQPQVLRQAIATFQAPDVSLAQDATYQTSLKTLPPNRIGWLYINAPTLLSWLGIEESPITTSLTKSGRRAHHLFASFQAAPSGLTGAATITAAPGSVFETGNPVVHNSVPILKILPSETLLTIAGKNLSRFLTETAESVGGYDFVQQLLGTLSTSLSLPSDNNQLSLWNSVEGDYALGLIAGERPTWTLVTQTAAQNPFQSIDDLAREQGLNVSSVRLGERDIIAWTRLSLNLTALRSPASINTQVIGVHTQIDGYEVFSTSLLGLQQIIWAEDAPSLSEQPKFAELANMLDAPYGSWAYIDWPHLSPLLLNRFPWLRVIEQAGQPLTAHLGPIFMSEYEVNPTMQQGKFAIKLLETP